MCLGGLLESMNKSSSADGNLIIVSQGRYIAIPNILLFLRIRWALLYTLNIRKPWCPSKLLSRSFLRELSILLRVFNYHIAKHILLRQHAHILSVLDAVIIPLANGFACASDRLILLAVLKNYVDLTFGERCHIVIYLD